ncbi:hypothetical protein ACOMHN_051858 [Nucella lapillus]
METTQVAQALVVLLSCLLLAAVRCDDSQDAALEDRALSQPQKRSVADLPAEDIAYPAYYPELDPLDKRSSLFRFGKRGSLFRFGKRGSLFRFGKRSSLFRFGKRGSLFRFGKRDGDLEDGGWVLFPEEEMPVEGLKRDVKSFHWGRETDE